MNIQYHKWLATTAMATLSLSLACPVKAQSALNESTFNRLDEIIVTARKRTENLQEIPLSISAFTADMIDVLGIQDMSDIAKFTPGFSLDEDFSRANGVRPIIRGQSTILGASGVSTFVDGVLLQGSLLDYDFNDIERIEVLKGPQSVLYGSNTYSGAINIITKSPGSEASGSAKIEAGSYGRIDLSGTMRGPLSDTVSASLTGRFYKRGGSWTNLYDGRRVGKQKSASLAGVLFYEPNDDLSVRARVRLSKLDDDQLVNFNTATSENNVFQDIGGVYNGEYRYFSGEIVNHAINTDEARTLGEPGYDRVKNAQASLSVAYNFNDNWSMEFVNGISAEKSDAKNDVGNTPGSFNPFSVYIGPVFPAFDPYWFHAFVTSGPLIDLALDSEGSALNYSSELRFNYSREKLDGLVGGYFFDGRSEFKGRRSAPADYAQMVEDAYNAHITRFTSLCAEHANDSFAPCYSSPYFNSILNFGDDLQDLEFNADRSISKTNRQEAAVFASLGYDLTDRLNVTASARYTSEKITSNSSRKTADYDYFGVLQGFTESPAIRREATFTSLNPRFSAKYKISPNMNLYAVAARGTKPGGFGPTTLAPLGLDIYDEESVWSFEAGSKNAFLDGELVFNLAGFHNTINGYQLTQAVQVPNINQTTSVTTNLGKVRLMGIEAEMMYRVQNLPGMVITANYAYTDSEFLRGTDITEGKHNDVLDDGRLNCSIGFANPGLPCAQGDNVRPGSIVGRQLPRQPKHMASAAINYSINISELLSMDLNLNASYESKKWVQVHNLAYTGATTLLNASVRVGTDHTNLTIWGRNLTDEDSVVSASRYIDENRSFQRAFLGKPRIGPEYGVTLRQYF